MHRRRTTIFAITALFVAAWAYACGDGAVEPPAPDPPRPTTVTVNPATARLVSLGATVRLSAEVRDQSGNTMAGTAVTWSSSDATVATVDASGLVTAAANGAVVVTATAGSVSGTAAVTVEQVPAEVAVEPAARTLVALGDTIRLSAEALDANGNLVATAEFAWSSGDTTVATVDASGLVTAAANGAVVVTATAGSVSGTAAVTVEQVPAEVAVEPAARTLVALGDTIRLSAEALDANGNLVATAEFAWSSGDTTVATVDASGLVTAAANGATTVTATAGSASGTAVVTVAQQVGEVTVSPAADTVLVADTLRLSARAADANGHPLASADFAWSSGDTLVAVVDGEGLVTGISAGEAGITATSAAATGRARLTVVVPAPATVAVTPDTVTLAAIGQTAQLSVEVRDQAGRVMDDVPVSWSSGDTLVVTVDSAGLLTAVGGGKAAIVATAGSASGKATVTVTQSAGSVVVSPATDTISPGDTLRLVAEAFDENGHVIEGVEFDWLSSDVSVAQVDASGLVRAVGEGMANVTATLGDASGTVEITVENPDRATLVALYNATDGPNWADNTNWLTDAPLWQWYGVKTDALGRVVSLSLSGHWDFDAGEWVRHGLAGPIPPEVGDLTSLRALHLNANDLSGRIPPELGKLGNLRDLYIGVNDLSGAIPPELGGLSNLERLQLGGNQLSGAIPPELGELSNLTVLDLGGNQLSGAIPTTLLKLALYHFSWAVSGLCAPGTSVFVEWLDGVKDWRGPFCNASDHAVLTSFYELAAGGEWVESDGWLASPALEEWHGVESDSLGRVTALRLSDNGLSGSLPGGVANLGQLTSLRIDGNELGGRLPLSLAALGLDEFHYHGTDLCEPAAAEFRTWLEGIPSRRGTEVECAPLTDRDALVALYGGTGGPGWTNDGGWLTEAPLRRWHGVEVDTQGRVVTLSLYENKLSGAIPPELGGLSNLEQLYLSSNKLSGAIPPELSGLSNLWLLSLGDNELSGAIPPELSGLSNLWLLSLGDNELSGAIPPELGGLSNLERLYLSSNELSGAIPPELGGLSNLERLQLNSNELSGAIPPELGGLSNLERLQLNSNELSGAIPPELGGLSSLTELTLSHNSGLAGAMPEGLVNLELESLLASGTELCAPRGSAFEDWLATIPRRRIALCGEPPAAYLVQAVQSRAHPVPLVAGEDALLRVFVTAATETTEAIPEVRARFYLNGTERHVADVPRSSTPIPTQIDEGDPAKSTSAEIPGRIVRPGLEMVVEIDPGGALDPGLGVPRRIPEEGRLAIKVREMPVLDLTVIPFLWSSNPDSAIIGLVEGMAADPEGHALLEETHVLLPVADIEVTAHAPVASTSKRPFDLLSQTEAIRVLEGGGGHYMGMMSGDIPAGVAYLPGRASFSPPYSGVIAHELGHNMSLGHAPCGGAPRPEPSFPYPDGTIGAWGYDFRRGSLVPTTRKDHMSYCYPTWTSDYHFTNALRHRLVDEGAPTAAPAAAPVRSLLLWGGANADDTPFLNPAFVADAPPTLPDSAGDYTVTGRDASGQDLFSLSFAMAVAVSEEAEASSFVFALPVQPGWADVLATVTLSGPDGTATLDGDSDMPMAILRDPWTGQVRGFLRGPRLQATTDAAGQTDWSGFDVLFSRGVPEVGEWRQ